MLRTAAHSPVLALELDRNGNVIEEDHTGPVPGSWLAARPELAVAGVAQAGHDVALLVELAVERRAVDLDVGVRGA